MASPNLPPDTLTDEQINLPPDTLTDEQIGAGDMPVSKAVAPESIGDLLKRKAGEKYGTAGRAAINPLADVLDVGVGAAKDLTSTVLHGGQALRQIPYVGKALSVADVNAYDPQAMEQRLQTVGMGQELGKLGSATAQYMGAGGSMAGVGKGLIGRATLGSIPKIPRVLLPLAAGVGEAIPEAAAAGTVAALRGEDVKTAATMAGATSGIGQAIGVSDLIPQALKNSSLSSWWKILRPTGDEEAFVAENKVIPEMLNKNVMVTSLPALERRVSSEIKTTGEKLGQIHAQMADIPRNMGEAIDSLEKSKQVLTINKTGVNAVPMSRQAKKAMGFIDEMQNTLKEASQLKTNPKTGGLTFDPLQELPNSEVLRLRQAWDKIAQSIYKGGKFEDEAEGWAHAEGANALRRILSKDAPPDLKELDATYSAWKATQDVLKRSIRRERGEPSLPFSPTLYGFIGPNLTVHQGIGMHMRNIRALPGSVAWRSVSANAKNILARTIMSGQFDEAATILGRIEAQLYAKQGGMGEPPPPPESLQGGQP